METYPIPGTNAEQVHNFVIRNPGTTTNNVITSLRMNPSVARKCLKGLEERNRVQDKPDPDGNHRWTAKGRVL